MRKKNSSIVIIVGSHVYLKSLVIKGFKSFAERSVMNFEPGISVIVGPNGSGKSNISEAVLWVLGERNPRNLRVQSLEELIFSGSSARKAVSVAEVDLVLDNSDNTLPIEFNQVALTRRMYRSGESEYFINGSPCRRMDIIDILYDTGIGQGANSIIGQGNLTQVLESRPEDRKSLIEDAAGVLKHKKRKERANRKLDAMDMSLARVNDIVHVIESQLRPLERQAKRAREHAELANELKGLDLSLAVDDLRALQSEWNQIGKRIKEIDAEAEMAHFRLMERETELNKRQVALEEKGLFAGDINEQRIRCLAIIQRLDAGMLLLEEKGKNMVSQLSGLRASVHNAQSRLSQAKSEHDNMQAEVLASDGKLEALNFTYKELSRVSESITLGRREAEQRYSEATATLRNNETALEKTKLDLAKTTDSLGSLKVEEDLYKERRSQVDAEYSSTQSLLVSRRAKLGELEQAQLRTGRDSELAKREIDKFVRLLDEKRKKLNERRENLALMRAELKGLEEIERALATAAPALNWVLEQKQLQGVVGPLSSAIKVRAGAKLPDGMDIASVERLTERLLGSDFFALLVENNDAALEVARALQEHANAKDESAMLSLLPLEGMRYITDRSDNGVRLLDLLDYPERYAQTLMALLGDIYLAPSVAEAQKYHLRDRYGLRFVTREAAIVWPNGKLSLGVHVDDIDGVLERRRRMEALDVEIASELTSVSELEIDVSGLEQNLEMAQSDDFELSSTVARLQGDLDAIRGEVTRLEEQMTAMLLRQQECAERLADISKRRDAATPLAGEYEQRIAHLEEQMTPLTEAVELASQTLLAATDDKNSHAERLSECKIELETSKNQATYARSQLASLTTEIAKLEKQLEVSLGTQTSLEVIRMRIDPLYKLYELLHDEAKVWAQRLHDQALLEQTDSENLRKVISDAAKLVDEARRELEGVNERRTLVLIEQGKLESSVKHAMQRIVDEHETSLEEAIEIPAPEDRVQAEDRVRRLRSRLENIGAVNHVAAEEYDALKARRDYMLAQTEDLAEARKSLAKISQALDRKMRNLYLETFNQVNRNFQEIFAILFPGGRGELLMIEGETPDDGGVEVSAQPAGKKITKLSMMSGGEKSLVAIALLFAIYKIRNVPFYILDEVEAALDDSNLRRLLEYLSLLRNKTQLIMVSHQRRTMETADVLYGVTMQAAGVSKLVSQRLEQAIGYASAEVADISDEAAIINDEAADTAGNNATLAEKDDA
ncbi:MAG: chromosome segregation protein SMC [Coriobacteriales bacterium]|jgi:chromosome segregation protein|nr:chromosome segregation protein SMC [Coriobacteriales bacterium]